MIAPDTILLGKYRVEQILGRGGMGIVVQARHETLDEVVAIKLLSDDVAVSAETFTRFVREARAAAKLKSKHVVRVSDVGRLDDGMPYMVMELLEGRDLNQILKARGAMDPAVVANLMIQVCEALADAHSHGIVHRDVKCSNLFVITQDDAPHVKVLDFGIAKAPESVDFSLTRTSSMLGTPGYMSPEQLRSSREVDHRTDIWSLGVVMYTALEGRRPFDAAQFSELCLKIGLDPTPPMQRTAPPLAAVVMRCLEKSPDHRYQSVGELAIALAPFARDRSAANRELERIERTIRTMASRTSETKTSPPGRFGPTAAVVVPEYDDTPPAHATQPSQPSVPPQPSVVSQVNTLRPRRGWLIVTTTLVLAAAGVTAFLVIRDDGSPQPSHVAMPVEPPTPTVGSAKPIADTGSADVKPPVVDPVVETKPPAGSGSNRKSGTGHIKRTGSNAPGARGSGSAVTVPSGSDAAGSATKPKPCDPYTDRHGC